jgi:hypothetical protein
LKRAQANQLQVRQDDPTSDGTAQIIPLRTETALSKFPIHRLSKKGTIKIKQTKKTQQGKIAMLWEVMHSPGPLGYKLDTAIINRRIDEYRKRGNIPPLIKLGSLGSICEELGYALSGRTADQIKDALKENAAALITARLNYRTNDGVEEYFEFSSTRYAIILTGQKLPDGRKADAVYIQFHDLYLSLLNRSQTRPLDYEYLKSLPPASQRLYELVSFNMFGALHHGRDCATMTYSELCATAPLTRYEKWDQAKKQLYKVHKPHLDSGYLKAVDYQATTDAAGRPDWIIRYTPGPKAKREYREFNGRKEEPAPRRLTPATAPKADADHASVEDPEMAHRIERLVEAGFGTSAASDLASKHADECDRQLNALPLRNLSKVNDRAAWLRCAIEQGYALPVSPEQGSEAKQEKVQKAAECPFCKDSATPEHRRIVAEKYPRGAWKPCTHDPEQESKFTSAD